MRYNLLLVEDQSIVRSGLKMMIEQDDTLNVIAEAENGEEALRKVDEHIIDVVVMDIRLPEMNGIETTRHIKRRYPDVHVLMLTTFNDEEYAEQSLREGADGFLLKTAEPDKLVQAIHTCLNGGMTIHEDVAAKVMPRLLNKSTVEVKDLPLSPRELSITRLVGEGKTNKEIATELYLSVGTVKNHITQTLTKLDLRDRTQLAIFAVKNNLV
ncbi:DNA-binding response regulator, NarL/FixJ family, contains REC and HTH domains [Salinibacillus kushneri]|uniref:DNA-binding response regulator, NarL/FixJ family, contains REC and HTH domains n=1 Tax=Salinibacillus kushneri TaxID=237682 RepID=A0A1I0GP18_9BACI|nr:response regulator transcription factor [Salinibacillus kushneri]SET72002.1 DNA-binding response regulator, NarL/FixJ family, contains REC and HTH domains [Salinibacillus kushneri]